MPHQPCGDETSALFIVSMSQGPRALFHMSLLSVHLEPGLLSHAHFTGKKTEAHVGPFYISKMWFISQSAFTGVCASGEYQGLAHETCGLIF